MKTWETEVPSVAVLTQSINKCKSTLAGACQAPVHVPGIPQTVERESVGRACSKYACRLER